MTGSPTSPLAGIRVLDLSRMFPGAYCTSLLADLGADVLKVEAPNGGDGMRFLPGDFKASHVALNRGKRSMTLDLRTDGGPDVLRRLARDVDVVVESHRPGALDRLGVGFEALRADDAGLVWCSLTGFGPDGPMAEAPGHDMTYLGYSGLMSTLTVGGRPVVPGSTITLALAGLMGAFGIVAAINARHESGRGCRVDSAIVDAARWVVSDLVAMALNDQPQSWPEMPSRANYWCADGRWITCTASDPKSWATLVEAIDAPDLASPRMGIDDAKVAARLTAIFASAPAARWLENPGPAGGIGAVALPGDVVDDPQVDSRGSVVRLEGDGPLVLANPLRLDGASGEAATNARGPAPELGQHTDEALLAAGFSPDEVAALRDASVV
ncbi:MAG: CoA transferase [Acidimicrobiia bacterium]|nr:CoA transferase [Acidimicrobiia bacterium]